jgi:hypothetical protein
MASSSSLVSAMVSNPGFEITFGLKLIACGLQMTLLNLHGRGINLQFLAYANNKVHDASSPGNALSSFPMESKRGFGKWE